MKKIIGFIVLLVALGGVALVYYNQTAITAVLQRTPSHNNTPTIPLPEEDKYEFLDQARDWYLEIRGLEEEIIERAQAEGGGDEEINEELDALYVREFGFDTLFDLAVLLPIHSEESSKDVASAGADENKPFAAHPLLLEYLRLSFEFPNLDQAGLLEKFRQSSRDGNISINPDRPRPDID